MTYKNFLAMKPCLPSIKLLEPKFPSLFALAELAGMQQETIKPRKDPGLFESLLNEPRVLYYEMLQDPARFSPEASQLIMELAHGLKVASTLSPEERQILDQATLDWAQPRHKPITNEAQLRSDKESEVIEYLTHQEAVEDPDMDLIHNEDGSFTPALEEEVPPTEPLPTYWWRQ